MNSMTTEMILVSSIDVPKSASAKRKVSKEGRRQLSNSIQADTMLQAIGVLPSETAGRYDLIWGSNRLEVAKSLGWTQIEAKVFPAGTTAEDIERIRLAENLFRQPFTTAEGKLAIKRWSELWLKRDEEKASQAAEPEPEDQAESEEGNYWLSPPENTPEPSAGGRGRGRPENDSGAKARDLAAMTGMAEETARKHLRIANTLTEEQLKVCVMRDLSDLQLVELCKLGEADRAWAVELIAKGQPFAAALKHVQDNGKGADANEPTQPKKRERDLTNDEWLQLYCGDVISRLADPSNYKTDAILYREIRDHRIAFRGHTTIKEAWKRGKNGGPFARIVGKFMRASHPCDWLICGTCNGTGKVAERDCEECWSYGYRVKMEM
jgi:hypothetical protein